MTIEINQANKRLVWDHWRALADASDAGLAKAMTAAVAPEFRFRGPDPINDLQAAMAFLDGYWFVKFEEK